MFFFTTVGRINGPWVNLEPKKKSFNQALGAPVKASRPAKPIHCVVVFINWLNDPFFIGRTCTGWAMNRICVLFSTCFGFPRTCCDVCPLFQIVDHPPSTTTVLQTQTARAVAPNHHTHCKTPVRLFHPLRVQFSRRPTPTPFHPSSLLFQRFAFRSYRWLRPPSLPSVPHGKFDQPPDCLYTV